MTPIESYINQRFVGSVVIRQKIEDFVIRMPQGIRKWIRGKLFGWPWRHMRSVSPNVRFTPLPAGGWGITVSGFKLTSSQPLKDWLGPVARPLTIIASGPSARDYDWNVLRGNQRVIVAVNGSPTFLVEVGLRPDFWVVLDHTFIPSADTHFGNAEGVPLAISFAGAAWLAEHRPAELLNRRVALIERVNQWHGVASLDYKRLAELNRDSGRPFIFPATSAGNSKLGWCRLPELGVFSGCTVVFSALQIVIGLGVKDIEIVGMDLTGTQRIYHEDKDKMQPSTLEGDYDKYIRPAFELMREAISGSDVRVRNLSKICRLPANLFD